VISILSLIVLFSWWYVSHNTCTLTLFDASHDLVFISTTCAIWILSVLEPCDLQVFSWKHFCYSLFEEFRTSWFI